VLVDGERINACLTLAVRHEGQEITTIEGWRMAHCSRCEPRVSPTTVFNGFPVCHSLF
jgi:aerobic-type carbon monoxide dehydrogenase small subunit (CoxS/CutS family)